jgi:protoporphyrinogen oxidase
LILLSYLQARLAPHRSERTFEQWVSNRFGSRLYRTFFKSYTEKVWGVPAETISADWAAQRIHGLSLPTAVLNALLPGRRPTPKSLIAAFRYPRYGPGQMWALFQQAIEQRRGRVLLDHGVVRIHHDAHGVSGVTVAVAGHEQRIDARQVISTMPLADLVLKLEPAAPADVQQAARQLAYRDYILVLVVVNKPAVFPDNWIYVHDPEVKVGRIQNFKNWSAAMVPDTRLTSLGLEYFCHRSDALWSRTDEQLLGMAASELQQLGLVAPDDILDGCVVRQPKAYPMYTLQVADHLERLRAYLARLPNLQTVGRNGLHKYNNQDHSMLTGMLAAENVAGAAHDVWSVNTDRSYYEQIGT